MRIRDHLILAAREIASLIDSTTDHRHLTTDPECTHHIPVAPGSRLDRASRGQSCSPCLADRAFGYHEAEHSAEDSAYTRATSDRLFARGLDITRAEIQEGLDIAAAAGIRDDRVAGPELFAFLVRLAPADDDQREPRRFIGWDTLGLALDTMLDGLPAQARNEVLARKWGNDGIRIAHAVHRHWKEHHA